VSQFAENAFALVDASVAAYQRRGFKDLMVSFGCTGGQHRSVYLAEQLAKHLAGQGGVEVELRHQELERIEHLGQANEWTRHEQDGPESQAV
jgi:RNase adaptor protein for sRNA GlmZ degradation